MKNEIEETDTLDRYIDNDALSISRQLNISSIDSSTQNVHSYDKIENEKRINRKSRTGDRLNITKFNNITDFNNFLEISKIQFENEMSNKRDYKETLDDFEVFNVLGVGVFGKKVLVKLKNTEKYSDMTVIDKESVVKYNQQEFIKREKKILESLNSPFAVYIESFFQDNCYAYLVIPFMPLKLSDLLLEFGRLNENEAKFYVSQVILAFEHLHYLDLVYRDLKPENILIDENGYMKLSSFGFCKRLEEKRTYTVCGTPEYFPPEVILNKGYGKAASWWGTGVLMYELVAGYPPFRAKEDEEEVTVFRDIVESRYTIPKYFTGELKDLIKHLIMPDLSFRLGNLLGGVNDIKYHKWFKTVSWLSILNKKTPPPHKPINNLPTSEDGERWSPEKMQSVNIDENVFEDF